MKLKLDASSLRESNCLLRWKRLIIDGIQQPVVNNDTLYGSAVHKFIYLMYMTGGDFNLAVKGANELFRKPCNIKPDKKHLTPVHLTKTCLDYWQKFAEQDDFEIYLDPAAVCFWCNGQAIDGGCKYCNGTGRREQPMVEVNFEIPILKQGDIELSVCGTIDKVGGIRNGCPAILDNKITSSWKQDDYLKQYDLSNQLRLYHWAILKLASLYPDSVFAQMAKSPIGTAVDVIFISSFKDTTFRRSEFRFYKPEEIVEFDLLIQKKVHDFYWLIMQGKDYNTRDGIVSGACHNGYGFCRYYNLCSAPDDIARQHLINRDYKLREYNPLDFGKD